MTTPIEQPEGGVHTLRRVITYILLFVMIIIAAGGLSGLIERLLDAGNQQLADDTTGLAQSLAFALIAGPLAAALWLLVWRGVRLSRDNTSVTWALYLMFVSTTALVVAVSNIVITLSELIAGRWSASAVSVAFVWAGVWWWHRRVLLHPIWAPSRMHGVTPTLGWFFGLAVTVTAAVSTIGDLGDTAINSTQNTIIVGGPWWLPILQGTLWIAAGVLVWAWYWIHDGAQALHTGFARVALVFVAGAAAVALTVWGAAIALHVVLRLVLDSSDPISVRLEPLSTAVAAALIGALVWRYYRGVVASHPSQVREATRLVASGVALSTAATGIGVTINALLAALGTPLTDSGVRSLLLGGLSALVVGAPLWWHSWSPRSQRDHDLISRPGRRIYLVSVFGVSALVALITLILIAFRLFELGLSGTSGQSTLEGVRAPVGLLIATLLVAGYHFALWRREKPTVHATPSTRTVNQVILVTAGDPEPARAWVEGTLGARFAVWRRTASTESSDGPVEPSAVEAALTGVTDHKVLIVHSDRGLEVIPLAE